MPRHCLAARAGAGSMMAGLALSLMYNWQSVLGNMGSGRLAALFSALLQIAELLCSIAVVKLLWQSAVYAAWCCPVPHGLALSATFGAACGNLINTCYCCTGRLCVMHFRRA